MKRKHLSLLGFLLILSTLVVALSDPFNTPPIFLAPTETEVQAYTEQQLNIDVEVEDVDGDALNIQIYNAPDWLQFDPIAMRLSGTPERLDRGEYIVTLKVDDGKVVRSKMLQLDVDYGHSAKQHLDEVLVKTWKEKLSKLPGFSAAIIQPDGMIHSFHKGYVNYNKSKKLTEKSRYRIASVSKLMTATLIMRLAEEGYLNIDDPLHKYLPIANIPYGKKMTIRQVMSHTAGLIDHLNHGAFYKGNWKYRKWSDNDIINFVARRRARFQPGKGYSYSNTGYYLLGMLIEKVLQQPLADAYQDWIFTPAEMLDSELDDYSTRKNRIPDLAENSRAYEYHQSSVGAAGAIISTPKDMALFGHALYNGKLVNEASLQEMTTDFGAACGGDHYGLGMRMWDDHGITHLGHSGLLMGYRSILFYMPEYKTTLAFTTNHSYSQWYSLVNTALIEMADYYQ
jgi:CubicO group peptidase (beta-lactamase class C family)